LGPLQWKVLDFNLISRAFFGARFYDLSFSNGMSFIQIASDGGYLPHQVPLTKLYTHYCHNFDSRQASSLVDFSWYKIIDLGYDFEKIF
jgi:hypothetical protein